MEAESGFAAADLTPHLDDVRGYAFFQLAHLLERYCARHEPVQVRYRALPSLGFPAADVDHCSWRSDGGQPVLDVTVSFMGLYGPASPLPVFYTERVIQSSDPDNPGRDLMDLFNHRSIRLLRACWEKYRYYTRYQSGGTDDSSRWLLSLLGMDSSALQRYTRLRWHRLLPLAGILLGSASCEDGLVRLVSAYFGLSQVRVQSWVMREVAIPPDQCTRLGLASHVLGEDCVLGDTVADVSGKFALHLEALSADQYEHFLPPGDGFAELVDLVHFALRDALDFDLNLWREAHERRPLRLMESLGGQLGWSSWLGEDAIEAVATVIAVTDYAG